MSADKARELRLTPMARIVGQATSGLAPRLVMMTPVEAVRKVAAKIGWKLGDVDLFEINEAFAVQLVAVMRELGIDPSRVNVHGGAVALGHPIGASGARVLTTLLYAMKRRQARRGIAALCLGGGNGVALAVELTRVNVRRVGVIGAGTMGNGIAQVFTHAGYEVRLVDTASSALDRARAASNAGSANSSRRDGCRRSIVTPPSPV